MRSFTDKSECVDECKGLQDVNITFTKEIITKYGDSGEPLITERKNPSAVIHGFYEGKEVKITISGDFRWSVEVAK